MILFQAINSVTNYLKNGFFSKERQISNKDWTIIQGRESYKISNLFLFQKATFSIQITDEGTVIYQKDGSILFIDQKDTLNQTKNLEQIKYLRWHGEYSNLQQKIGKWYASWKGEIVEAGGNYCNRGLKTGEWIELFENFWDKSQVTFRGQYFDDNKQGKCGGGYYDQVGIKQGYWIDLHQNFYDGRQIVYKGNYQNNTKVGQWDIAFQSYFDNRFKKIGGGVYNRDGKKDGKWVEESENFWNGCQILEKGEYKNGLKIGIWESLLKEYKDDHYKLIGIGCYDNDIKNGKWTEIHEKFMSVIHSKYYECKIINVGNFIKGLKIGRWKILDQLTYNVIGGGDFDEYGQKTGIWLEVEDYSSISKISLKGRYKNGKKEGKWQTNFNNQKIGGGSYNDRGLKFGLWIEINDKFWEYCKVLFVGNYQEGIKTGNWEILFCQHGDNKFKIGRGSYNDNGMKIGQWTELSETFWDNSQVIHEGYYLNGIKSGGWNAFFTTHVLKQYQLIGGGKFDRNGVKFGKWVDLDENFQYNLQIIYVGKYKDGIKEQEFQQKKLKLFQ